MPKNRPARPPTSGSSVTGRCEFARADRVERVGADERAQPVVHRVAEGQQPALPEQHVVGQREDDRDAHLAQHRQREALAGRRAAARSSPARWRPTQPATQREPADVGCALVAERHCHASPFTCLAFTALKSPAFRAGPSAGRSASAPSADTAAPAPPGRRRWTAPGASPSRRDRVHRSARTDRAATSPARPRRSGPRRRTARR